MGVLEWDGGERESCVASTKDLCFFRNQNSCEKLERERERERKKWAHTVLKQPAPTHALSKLASSNRWYIYFCHWYQKTKLTLRQVTKLLNTNTGEESCFLGNDKSCFRNRRAGQKLARSTLQKLHNYSSHEELHHLKIETNLAICIKISEWVLFLQTR